AGTVAAVALLLASVTTMPPAGAGPLRVTVPVEEVPPFTMVGLSVSVDSVTVTGGAAATVSVADCVTPPAVAEMAAVVDAVTVVVVTVKVALVAPAGTVTL